ncbi:MAG: hypothetical protein CFH23_00066 [Alphaproteobacteria bacterium MarineAlpha6_Bin1]|nr:MAG: hypothetical protein CFH23_00066 [Alphaproteobacteria bacterium MarineAlpha6_Bin1]
MTEFINRIYKNTVIKHPIFIIFLLIFVLGFFSLHIKNFELDASADSLILEDDQDLKIYRKIINKYDTKDFVIITYKPNEDLFSQNSFQNIKNLKTKLTNLENVHEVITLIDLPLLKTLNVPLTQLSEDKIKRITDPSIDIDLAKKEILESPIFKNLIVSEDGQLTSLIVNLKRDEQFNNLLKKRNDLRDIEEQLGTKQIELDKVLIEYDKRKSIIKKINHQNIASIREIIKEFSHTGEIHLGGVPMIAHDMIEFIKSDLINFGIGVFLFIVITLIIVFREIRWVTIPLLNCFYAVLIMVGILGFVNWDVTVISSNFISLMLILTIAMNVHLAVRYKQLCSEMTNSEQSEIVFVTTQKMVWPCLYTALTTICAFTSLVFSGIKPVIDFGWMMTIGLSVTFLTSFTLFPSVLLLLEKKESSFNEETKSHLTGGLAYLAKNHGNKILFLSGLLIIVTIVGITKLKVENSFINYFKEKTEIYQGMKLIDEKFGGTTPLDIIINFKKEVVETNESPPSSDDAELGIDDDFFDIASEIEINTKDYWFTSTKIKQIEKVHDYLENLPEIGKVLSLSSLIRVAEDLNEGKEFDPFELNVIYKKLPEKLKKNIVDPYISIEHNEARINLRVLDSQKDLRRKELIEKINSDLKNKLELNEEQFQIAGVLVLYNNMLQSLFDSQIKTIIYVMLGIAIMFVILFRSLTLSIIGIIPNFIAAVSILGIMGLLKLPLDMMTITIASITIGIAVDNSIHYIYRFREEFKKINDYEKTIDICHMSVGRAIFNTSVTIIFGFSILVLSNFIPTIYFGLFTGLAMLIAMLSVLTLLPKLILMIKPF